MSFKLTDEQAEAVELFKTGESLAIEAGAGTGKTSTLVAIAKAAQEKGLRGLYTAFNKAIVVDSDKKLPNNVKASTVHALAFGAVGWKYATRMNSTKRIYGDEIARIIKLPSKAFFINGKELQKSYLAGQVMEAIKNFCSSADFKLSTKHFSYIEGIDDVDAFGKRLYENNNIVRNFLFPYAEWAWEDIQAETGGKLPFQHLYYLKLWQLSKPKLKYDFILFDEAQDADPVMLDVIERQTCQLVYVGDSQQAIYEWRGAINALAKVTGERTFLTNSFRFGYEVAEAANVVLALLDADLRLVGRGPSSTIGAHDDPTAVLCRTNAGAIKEVIQHLFNGKKVALSGGSKEIISFCKGAQRLQSGQRTDHQDLACFNDWAEVNDYVKNDPQGSELRLFVKLIEDFGVEGILEALTATVDESKAQITVSTAHKSKGREWEVVQIGSDFFEAREDQELGASELRLLYVAVTRAQKHLDYTRCGVLQNILGV